MSAMTIEYSRLNNFVSAAKKYSSRLEDRMDDYNGIKSKVSSIDTSRNNLSQSCYFIKKKNEKLGEKKEKIDRFRGKVETFIEDVKQADKRVATRIKEDTNTFGRVEGINTSYAAHCLAEFAEWVKAKVKDITSRVAQTAIDVIDSIKEWYNNNKYIIHMVIDAALVVVGVLALAAAIVAAGPALAALAAGFSLASAASAVWAVLGVVASTYSLFNSMSDFAYDTAAASYYHSTGDSEGADELDSKGGKDVAAYYGAEGAYEVIGVVSTVRNYLNIGKNAYGAIKNSTMGFKVSGMWNSIKNNKSQGMSLPKSIWQGFKDNKPAISDFKATFKQFGIEKYKSINKTYNNNKIIEGMFRAKDLYKNKNIRRVINGATPIIEGAGSGIYNTLKDFATPASGTQKVSNRLYINNYSNMQFVGSYGTLQGAIA